MSETAFLVAYCRALESEALAPIVRDPHARTLAGERGRLALEALPLGSRQGWPIAVRTRVYDELILGAIQRGEVGTVLNLGAGLDTRPYRLDLPASLSWIEADRPAILRYKTEKLSCAVPKCLVERCPIDLADIAARRALLERVGREHDRVFVLTEGVLAYLEEYVVAALAAELRSLPAMRLWAVETLSHSLLAHQGLALGELRRSRGIELKFAPVGGVNFFVERGWRPRQVLPFLDEARRLGRVLLDAEQSRSLRSASTYILVEPDVGSSHGKAASSEPTC